MLTMVSTCLLDGDRDGGCCHHRKTRAGSGSTSGPSSSRSLPEALTPIAALQRGYQKAPRLLYLASGAQHPAPRARPWSVTVTAAAPPAMTTTVERRAAARRAVRRDMRTPLSRMLLTDGQSDRDRGSLILHVPVLFATPCIHSVTCRRPMASSSWGLPLTTFADRLKELRRAAGLSQTELAGDGISPSYVSLLESGRRTPSPGVAAQLAAKLGCSVTQLLEGEPSERERRVQLELAYAELALRHGGAETVIERLRALLAERELTPRDASEASLLLARAHELKGDLPSAVTVLLPLFEDARR